MEVARLADYKNAPLLGSFLSGARLAARCAAADLLARACGSVWTRRCWAAPWRARDLAWLPAHGRSLPSKLPSRGCGSAPLQGTGRLPCKAALDTAHPVPSSHRSADAGKLPLRRTTHLRAKLHRRLARQIKVARQLAILSPTERYVPPSLAAAAERYSKQSPQRQRSARQGRRQQQQQQQ